MKFLSAVALIFCFSSFAQTRSITLTAKQSLNVTCQKGLVLAIEGSTVKCGCPVNTFAHFEGEVLKCDSLCEITVGMTGGGSAEHCDQGGCYTYQNESYNAVLLLNKTTDATLYSERIYSPRQSEVNMLLGEAKEIAKKECFMTIYNGKEI